jgi:hypothetical protein
VIEDKAKALDMFNKGEGGFIDRDFHVFCANASDSTLTMHPTMKCLHASTHSDYPSALQLHSRHASDTYHSSSLRFHTASGSWMFL